MLIRHVPPDERPRERLLSEGPQSLSNQELLAILLRTGTKQYSVLTLAQHLLTHFEGLRQLKDATIEEMTSIKGIGKTKAIQIIAALELGRRVHQLQYDDRYVIRSPEDGARYVMEDMRFLSQEHFVVLYLNTKNQVMHKKTVFIGSLNASIVHPREVYKEAIKRSAASIICIHNHPSGDPTPSREDIEVTRRLAECGRLVGIELLDHLIIGDKTYVSLKEKGYV
ncbi:MULTISPECIES: RadC family protein [Anoxybacillus]|uniref:DNA repair protein RadC n=2 Tax=Anoxybacillus TaxID=150247 RepID=A0A7W8N7S3_9BACL|nr:MULTISPECIES: DNA repair protein RadC [Anoxybacillus]AXM89626.1 JAB domain-containing protein [Anoxybacillus ayderensis G10]MCL6616665.1 DNA repair protein RadC [Anoxybacillus ayderensis]EMI10583.1 DNA repair protein RadC [Anoxybacillus gonensis]MBB5354688.1 DNA repair protein RadC [Anoxybacillus mongoliensis]MBW9217767.1 DNA repair protein RadC [Anoxybacillus sp. ST70]